MSRRGLPTILFAVALVAVALPRFDRRDAGVGALTARGRSAREVLGDARYYVATVRHFRGETDPAELRMPFAGRVLAPWLASRLPLPPMTALNVVNLAALLGCLLIVTATMRRLDVSAGALTLGQALFVFSFPTFYYATVGYVEPVLLFFLGAVVWGAAARRPILCAALFVTGCAAKETMVLAAPALLTGAWHERRNGNPRALPIAVLALAAGAAVVVGARSLVPAPPEGPALPTAERLLMNVGRVRAWASNLLAFGPLGAVAGGLLLHASRRDRLLRHAIGPSLLIGSGGAVLLAGYAFAAAYADGRFLWAMYPFAVPMIGLMATTRRPAAA